MHLIEEPIAMLREFAGYRKMLEKCFPVAVDYAKAPEPSRRIDHLGSGQSRETDDRFDGGADGGVQHIKNCQRDFSSFTTITAYVRVSGHGNRLLDNSLHHLESKNGKFTFIEYKLLINFLNSL